MTVEFERMQQRRDTAAAWADANPILLVGELGYDIDARTFRIGDGVNHWVDLSPIDFATAGALIAAQFQDPNTLIGGALANVLSAVIKVGMIYPWAVQQTVAVPNGWLLCEGQAVSRTTYADLFGVLGTQWGAGNGTSTFNVPDLRGRTLYGQDTGQTAFDTIGKTAGEKAHSLTVAEMPPHTHPQVVTAGVPGSTGIRNDFQSDNPGGNSNQFSQGVTTGSTGGAGPAGSPATVTPHNNLPPYAVTRWLIRASGPTEWTSTPSGTIDGGTP